MSKRLEVVTNSNVCWGLQGRGGRGWPEMVQRSPSPSFCWRSTLEKWSTYLLHGLTDSFRWQHPTTIPPADGLHKSSLLGAKMTYKQWLFMVFTLHLFTPVALEYSQIPPFSHQNLFILGTTTLPFQRAVIGSWCFVIALFFFSGSLFKT